MLQNTWFVYYLMSYDQKTTNFPHRKFTWNDSYPQEVTEKITPCPRRRSKALSRSEAKKIDSYLTLHVLVNILYRIKMRKMETHCNHSQDTELQYIHNFLVRNAKVVLIGCSLGNLAVPPASKDAKNPSSSCTQYSGRWPRPGIIHSIDISPFFNHKSLSD